MIYITGDCHSDFSRFTSKKWPIGKTLTKEDYVIICGDFGGVWYYPGSKHWDEQEYNLDWLNDNKFTTLFIDGNHENAPLLYSYPQIEKFNGTVGQIRNSIFHLRRGQVYTINNKKFFTYGGAISFDKNMRVEGVTWWPEELPTVEDEMRALDNLEKNQYRIDYIITHTAPKSVIEILGYYSAKQKLSSYSSHYEDDDTHLKYNDPTTRFLQHVSETTKFSRWYFGHFHEDKSLGDNYRALYQDIIRLS